MRDKCKKPLMQHAISLLVFDLDGTLLNSRGEISEKNLTMLKAAADRGAIISICSGRVPPMLKVYADLMDIRGPYSAANGAAVVHHLNNKALFFKPMETAAVTRLVQFYEQHGLEYSLLTDSIFYYSSHYPRLFTLERYNSLSKNLGGQTVESRMLENNFLSYNGEAVLKSLTRPQNQKLYNELEVFLKQDRDLSYTFSESGLFEISAAAVSKGKGLRMIADYYGIPMKNICVMGDFDNDITMFLAAGLGIAMGNASDALLAVADLVTGTNDNDGVAEAINLIWNCLGPVNNN